MPIARSTRRRRRLWAFRVALMALAMQVLMPISHSMAANNVDTKNTISSNTLSFCAPFGVNLQQDANLNEAPYTAKAPWDCPICQLQIGTDQPKAQIFSFKINGLEKGGIAPAPAYLLADTYYTGPHPPRAPPGV